MTNVCPTKLLLLRPVSEETPLSQPQTVGVLLGSPAPLAPTCSKTPGLFPDYFHSSDHTAKHALLLIWPLPTPLASRGSSMEPQNQILCPFCALIVLNSYCRRVNTIEVTPLSHLSIHDWLFLHYLAPCLAYGTCVQSTSHQSGLMLRPHGL